ncbi:MAG: hypothetical protein KUG67_00835, partial [Proteobacteria bacterium]|nr:hypothetical protein [Pseudomonadota bacterium]
VSCQAHCAIPSHLIKEQGIFYDLYINGGYQTLSHSSSFIAARGLPSASSRDPNSSVAKKSNH